MAKIAIDGLKLEHRKESASVEIIHGDGDYLRINIHDQDEMMLTRVEIAVENNIVILKTWLAESWSKRTPDQTITLAYL